MHLLAAVTLKKTIWHAVRRFGGPGLVILGLVDNSVIPLPGSMDACTILLAAAHHEPWWYYALMATVGGVVGGYVTYRLGLKGGKEALQKRLSKKRADQVCRIFSRYGFWSVAVGAILPPPAPIVPILIAAGALQYPRKKFVAALAFGRGLRYTLLAYLGFHYGRHILGWLGRYYQPLLYILIAIALAGGAVGLYYWLRYRRRSKNRSSATPLHKPA